MDFFLFGMQILQIVRMSVVIFEFCFFFILIEVMFAVFWHLELEKVYVLVVWYGIVLFSEILISVHSSNIEWRFARAKSKHIFQMQFFIFFW